jgi:PPP family 3-phenylpropionic acid transporter
MRRFAWPSGTSLPLRREHTALRMLYFLYYGSFAAWSPFFAVYLRQVGLSGIQIGALTGIRPAVAIAGQPLWGVVADLWGRRRTLLLTILLASVLLPGFTWSTGFWFLLSWSVLYAFLSNPSGPLIDSLALDYVEGGRHLSFGQFRLWGGIGWAIMAYMVGRAIDGRDLRLVFTFGAILMFLGWFLALLTSRKPGDAGVLGSSWQDIGPLLRNRRLLIFLVLVMLLQVGASSTFTFFPIYMNELGASPQLIGLAYGVQGLSELPLYLIAATIIRRVGLSKTLALTFLVFSVRAFLYSFISQPVAALAVQLVHGSVALVLVTSAEYVNQQVPKAWRATGQSLFWAAHLGAGSLMGNALAGFLYDQMGTQAMFRLSGFLILGVALAAMVALREQPMPRNV